MCGAHNCCSASSTASLPFPTRQVPVSVDVRVRSDARIAAVMAEAAASPYSTVEKQSLAAAAADPVARMAARPPLAQPRDPQGEQ